MWYVIQTTTGKEQELVDVVHKMLPKASYKECFFLKRQLMKRLGGEWLEVTETLFPAYVFLEIANPDNAFYQLKKIPEFTKLLGDNQGEFIPLEEEETRFLKLLLGDWEDKTKQDRREPAGKDTYLVRNTRVYLDNCGKIKKMKGPLERFRDKIIRLNLRKRYALIEITIHGEKQTALLGIKLEKD